MKYFMRLRILNIVLIIAPLFVSPILTYADFDAADRAFKKGDYAKAFKELQEDSSAEAQYNIGVLYFNGLGVVKNKKLAIQFFHKAADMGNSSAQYQLGYIYVSGDGAAIDHNKAFYWFEKAASNYHEMAMYELARCYQWGRGTKRNFKKAIELYEIAASFGDKKAKKSMSQIEDKRWLRIYENKNESYKIDLISIVDKGSGVYNYWTKSCEKRKGYFKSISNNKHMTEFDMIFTESEINCKSNTVAILSMLFYRNNNLLFELNKLSVQGAIVPSTINETIRNLLCTSH